MTTAVDITTEQKFLEDLISAGHLLPSGEPGIFGRGAIFEDVRTGVDALVTRAGAQDRAEILRFPPVMPKCTLESSGYLKSTPQLCGAIFSFEGSEADARELAGAANTNQAWGRYLTLTNVVLVPAACYPAYPAIARRGPLPEGGVSLDLGGCYVFRHEPSLDPARLQMFHQRELVRIGETNAVLAWRETWISRARTIFSQIGLDATLDLASDPFFGRGGKLLANSQREQRLKFEMLVPIASPGPTAVTSFNFHQDHFGSGFGIRLHDGTTASSACVGFGLERITLALFRAHGLDPGTWPKQVRNRLWPEAADVGR